MPIATPNTPKHIAIIMDGNGRWAQKRFMPLRAGHVKSAAGVKALVEHCAKQGVNYLTLFAFSTEDWRRPADEVSALMGLFVQYLGKETETLAEAGVRLKVIGDVADFAPELQQCIHTATANNTAITLCVAANYGGRWDVLQAEQSWHAVHPHKSVAELTKAALAQHLSTADMPEVDLLIRRFGQTGEQINQPHPTPQAAGRHANPIAACLRRRRNQSARPVGHHGRAGCLAGMLSETVGYSGEIVFDESKPDGTMRKCMDVSRINAIGRHAFTGLKAELAIEYKDYLEKAQA